MSENEKNLRREKVRVMWMRGEQISDVSRCLRWGEAQFGVNVVKEVVRKKMKEIKKIKIGTTAATVFKPSVVTAVFAVLAIGIVGVSASGPTYVSGIISSNTTWTAADSPYIVTGNILVEEGVTLTIEPGVVVKFDLGKAMQIDGELVARGTEAEPIVFTSNQPTPAPGDWVNIVFTDSSVDATYDENGNYLSGSIMQYCTVQYGGGSNTPVLKIVKSSPFIDFCIVRDNAFTGIWVELGSPKISNNRIINNSGSKGGGIYAYTYQGAALTISQNTISHNSANSGGGIHTYGGTVNIRGNTIGHNTAQRGGGIYIDRSEVTINGNVIIDNSASQEGGAIYTYYYCAVAISYNTIINNSISQADGKGAGVYILRSQTLTSGEPTINYNNIYNNTPYDVCNSNEAGTPDVDATNNWWGTTDESTIQAHIYDWLDDASLGIVDYIPYLTEPVLPTQPPIASFTYSPENPIVNQTITFNASGSYDPDGYIISYEWDFGDGNITSTTEEKINHSYSEAGSYKVTLTVKDDKGATNSTTKIITVMPAKPRVSISTDKYGYTAGDVMFINITLTNPRNEWQGVKFLWILDILDYDKHFTIIKNRSLMLPAFYDKTFTLRWKLPELKSSFNASWHVAIFNKTTSELISEDYADWKYAAEKAKKTNVKKLEKSVREIIPF